MSNPGLVVGLLVLIDFREIIHHSFDSHRVCSCAGFFFAYMTVIYITRLSDATDGPQQMAC